MHYLHKLQEAKKHNGQDEKALWVWLADQRHWPSSVSSGEGGKFAQELKWRHCDHAALET